MRPAPLLITAAAAAAFSAIPQSAQAAQAEYVDRPLYDATVDQTAGSMHLAGETRGELGGYLDITVRAKDATLPTGSNVCERAIVDAVVTVRPGQTLVMRSRGDLCTGFYGDSITMNAGIRTWNLRCDPASHKARIVGEGLLSFGWINNMGGQASFSASVKW